MKNKSAQILVIDDEVGMRDLVREVLTIHGYETLGAQNAREALTILAQHPVDLTILDINLPDMSTTETVMAIRERRPGHRIVLMTCEAPGQGVAHEIERTGACDVLFKPFRIQTLLGTVGRRIKVGSNMNN